jgi:hypothetical protein
LLPLATFRIMHIYILTQGNITKCAWWKKWMCGDNAKIIGISYIMSVFECSICIWGSSHSFIDCYSQSSCDWKKCICVG